MKRVLSTILCLAMVASLLVGCGKDGKDSNGADGKVTLTIGLPQNTNIDDYETNAFTLWLEETTGYNLEFQLFASSEADYKSQLATMVAGGEELPDIIWGMNLGQQVYRDYGEGGYFLDLTPYFEDELKSGDWWDRIESLYPEEFKDYVKRSMAEKDTGKYWSVPRIECTEIDTMHYQVFINQTWLDNLGLQMPTDTESLYKVLKAFVSQDPNGNGKKDEIGLIGRSASDGNAGVVDWILNMFVNESNKDWWNVDAEGNLYLPHITDEYRQGLIYINKLVSEGLMPDSVWSMTDKDITTMVNPANGENTVGIFAGHPSIVFQDGQESLYEYVALPGWGYSVRLDNPFQKRTFVSAETEHPDEAWNLLMTMCSEEGSLRMRYGEKGVDWDDADEGTTSFLGREAKIKVLNENAYGPGNQTWNVVDSTILIDAEQETRQMDSSAGEWSLWKLNLMKDVYDAFEAANAAKPEVRAPHLSYTWDEANLTSVERANCQNWIYAETAKFCCGTDGKDPSDDADWQAYLKGLEKEGLEVWQTQAQKIYNEQVGNK